MERISSRQNAMVKRFRELARSPHPGGEVLLDGAHLLEAAMAAGVRLEAAAFAEPMLDGALRELANVTARAGIRTLAVTPAVLSAMSPVRTPSGVVAIAHATPAPLAAVLGTVPQLVVVLHEVQDPGNVGAVIRAAESFGATGVISTEGTADPFGWKALRGAMGSAFRLPIATRVPIDRALADASAAGVRIAATVPRGGTLLPACDLRTAIAVVLGGEGPGLPDALVRAADERITIPMLGQAESINVATAAALVLYEAARQRQRW